jgi:glycosyltransferase involved in cell wall biosynthesis
MHNFLITIAIPVYERYDFFEEALGSALLQTVNCQVIVVDNHSSHSKFKDYVNSLNNPNIKYFLNATNLGMIENWNRCIELCETQWLTILHDDDWLHPNFIEHINLLQSKYSEAGCFTVSCMYSGAINEEHKRNIKRRYRTNKVSMKYFLFGGLSPFPGVVFKVKAAAEINGFLPSLFPVSDYDFWVRLSQVTPIYRSSALFAVYRITQQQGTKEVYKDIIEKSFRIRKELAQGLGAIWKFLSYYNLFILYQFYARYDDNKMRTLSNFKDEELKEKFFKYERLAKSRVFDGFIKFITTVILRLI